MTLRCDGNSAEHVAFGGPILYAHDGEATFEAPTHPSNVFWHQAVAANTLYGMFDGKQRDQALVLQGMPSEELVAFRGPNAYSRASRSATSHRTRRSICSPF